MLGLVDLLVTGESALGDLLATVLQAKTFSVDDSIVVSAGVDLSWLLSSEVSI